jgi:RNA polymerase sigma factor (sigma-70 family)
VADLLDVVILAEERAEMSRAIDSLHLREGYVLRSRYDDGLTLEEIGARLGVSRSRVGQISNAAENRICDFFGVPRIHG